MLLWIQSIIGSIGVAMVLAGVGAKSAAGSIITIGFSGTITFVDEGLPVGDLIEVGTSFEGRYSYESEAPDVWPDDPIAGVYLFPSNSLIVAMDDLRFEASNIGVGLYNYSFYDVYTVQTLLPFSAYDVTWQSMNVELIDDIGTALVDDLLPTHAPDLADFAYDRTFSLIQQFHFNASLTGEITWMACIPEPCTLLMLSTGASLRLLRRSAR